MGDTGFPLNPDDLRPAWLTDAPRKDGCIERARVASLSYEVIGEGVGFLGQIARITPAYDVLEDGAPRTLIGKFPAPTSERASWRACTASTCVRSTPTAT